MPLPITRKFLPALTSRLAKYEENAARRSPPCGRICTPILPNGAECWHSFRPVRILSALGAGGSRRCRSGGPGAGPHARRAGHGAGVGDGAAEGLYGPHVPGPTSEFQKRTADPSAGNADQRDLADILALSGGMPIRVGEDTIGAVGSAGSNLEQDEARPTAGIAHVAHLLK
jgi:hypothetical protein